jgi:YgiT-type zinc finger domain-containing protein
MDIKKIIDAIQAKRIRITDHADDEAQADNLKYEEIYFSVLHGEIMTPFDKCPICGNDIVDKEVEKLLRGGKNTAVVKVQAQVCLHCGERLYSEEQVRMFEQIRAKLARNETQGYQHLGQSYQVSL